MFSGQAILKNKANFTTWEDRQEKTRSLKGSGFFEITLSILTLRLTKAFELSEKMATEVTHITTRNIGRHFVNPAVRTGLLAA